VKHATRTLQRGLVWLAFLGIAAFVLLPLLWGLRTSFAPDLDNKVIPSFLTLKNYSELLSRPEILLYSRNSLVISLCTIIVVLPVGLIGAYALARFQFVGKNLGFLFMIIPLLPAIAVLVPLVAYMNRLHLYNSLVAVILVNSVFNLPFATWMLRNFILANPISIEEAALIDGCSRVRMLFTIAIPMMTPGIVAVVVYTFINSWNALIYSFALTPSPTLRVMPQGILAFMGSWGTQWGGITAVGMLALLPPLLLFLIFQRTFVAGLFGYQLK